MIVYSVKVEFQSGETRYEGAWTDEWAARAWALENNTDCNRELVQWQMLNVDQREYFPAGQRT